MHDQRVQLEGRLDRFVTDHLAPSVYRATAPVTVRWWEVPGEPVPFGEAVGQVFEPMPAGSAWGRPWGTVWLHVTGEVPAGWACPEGSTTTELVVDLGFDGRPGGQAEGLVLRPDGRALKGINPRNRYVQLASSGPVDLYVEAAANPGFMQGDTFAPTVLGDPATAGTEPLYRMGAIELCLRDVEVWELLQDVRTLSDLMRELPHSSARRADLLRALQLMVDEVDPQDVAGTAAAGRARLKEVLAQPAHASAHRVTAVGHAHIDSAWLWPVRETVRKCARTFSSVLALADADPEFRFVCSSAQQYAWVEEHYPELFARIREKVANGQFIPAGGMWVESDTNLPGGEALARQFTFGQRYFEERFGAECREVWLPDSFGYSAALPQIAAAAGANALLTQKLSWNDTNTLPHHTFAWEGIDGTRVLTHFPPVDRYNSDLSGADLARAERQHREKGFSNRSLVPYGHGDGGGGPTREMVATAHRLASLEGSPAVELGTPASFFETVRAEYGQLPVWRGEMYLELHRGTYTSQARTKRGNRRSEHLLREAELWAATAAVRTGRPYPYEDLDRLWEQVLLLQFHDILPGSSIAWVHQDAEHNYESIARRAEEIIGGAVGALVGSGRRRLLLNAAPHARDGVPALGGTERERAGAEVAVRRGEDSITLDNGLVRVTVDGHGHLVSLRDLATGREAIAPGAVGNRLQLHRDTPNRFDAWDIDEHHRRVVGDVDEAEVELGDATDRAEVVVRRRFGRSAMVQRIVLEPGSPSVEIVNEVDWHEKQRLLKLGFALDVHAENSSAETQFGHVRRPTHTNTSWEAARFEICAHRWIHVEEPGYGVAISNDGVYGHDVTRLTRDDGGTTTTVRLSLLRAPLFPDPGADQGRHTSRITVRPGAGVTEAVEEGYRTNLPVRSVRGAREVPPLLEVSNPAIVVEAVKLADDRSGDVVVRLYEALGGRASGRLVCGFDATEVVRTDLRERPCSSVEVSNGAIDLVLRPFEIVTLRLVTGRQTPGGERE